MTITKLIDIRTQRPIRELASLLIEHYELPYYHPVLKRDVKIKLMKYAEEIGYGEFVQGYIDRVKKILEKECQIPTL